MTFERGDRIVVVSDEFNSPPQYVGETGIVRRNELTAFSGRPIVSVILDGRSWDDDELFFPEQIALEDDREHSMRVAA